VLIIGVAIYLSLSVLTTCVVLAAVVAGSRADKQYGPENEANAGEPGSPALVVPKLVAAFKGDR
jgi:hypothetical protein